jgi:hypothetical protein
MRVREHDSEDLAKGWLRIGREFKSEPVDITNEVDDVELIPCWKQIGSRPNNGTEDALWLWDQDAVTKYGLLISPEFKNNWYIYLNGKNLGSLILEDDNTYTVSINVFAAFYSSKKNCTKKEAILYCLKLHSKGHEYR